MPIARWLRLLSYAVVLCCAVAVLAPWWLGTALRPLLRKQGITFDRYERVGYARFRLHEVRYGIADLRLTAGKVGALTPLVWLGERLFGKEPGLEVADWSVQLAAAPDQPAVAVARGSPPLNGLPDLQAIARQFAPQVIRWLPRAQLRNGTIRGLGPELMLASADWHQGSLTAAGLRVAGREIAFTLVLGPDGTATLRAHTADDEARLELAWRGEDIKGGAWIWGQPVELAARFHARGWLPAAATATAAAWQLPAARLGLGSPYAQLNGSARLQWREQAWDLALEARAEPAAADKISAPPFTARAAAHGTRRELTLTTLAIDAPFATASLTAPVTLSLDRPPAAASAMLTVRADLAKLPWLEARGQVDGTVRMNGAAGGTPQQFDLKIAELGVRGFSLHSATARGELRWPRLELASLEAQFDETSRLQAHGAINLQTHELSSAAVQAHFTPTWFARWLPAGLNWTEAEIAATLAGPIETPRHAGSLKVRNASRPPVHPLALDVEWQGRGWDTEIRSARATAGASVVDLAGTVDQRGARLTKLDLTAKSGPVWSLAAPARLTWSPTFQLDDLRLASPTSSLALSRQTGPKGNFKVAAAGFDSRWLLDWLDVPGPAWQVHTMAATGQVAAGVLNFETEIAATVALSPVPAVVKLSAGGNAQGIALRELSVEEGGHFLTHVSGRLPLTVLASGVPRLHLDSDAPLVMAGTVEPDSPVWPALSAATGLKLVRPQAQFAFGGTPSKPTGELRLQAEKLNLDSLSRGFPLPETTDLRFHLKFDRAQITLATLSAKLDGQGVQASGILPMPEERWRQLWHQPAAIPWQEASGSVEVPEADLAALARRVPELIAPRGKFQAALELRQGKFSGEVHLRGAATRPLQPLGTMQDINADLSLADRTVTIQRLMAELGGVPVTVTGQAEFPPGGTPRLAVGLKGENVPLVRRAGLLVRSDLDLLARTDGAGVTRLTGEVTLRDCLILAGLDQLLAAGPKGVTRRPPYFALEVDPFQHWPLDINVRGPGTIRIRTAVMAGKASVQLHLGGTLGEPRAVGIVTADTGNVLFPFASFKVQQGTVRLSEAAPFTPVVNFSATTQQRGYELRMEGTGSLPTPSLVFSSTPALSADAVLRMVMTGEPPGGTDTVSTSQRLALVGAYLGRGLFQELGIGGDGRLEVTAGAQVSERGRETYEFEYKLGRDWSIVGSYDQHDNYNAGLKWRVYTQESLPDAKK